MERRWNIIQKNLNKSSCTQRSNLGLWPGKRIYKDILHHNLGKISFAWCKSMRKPRSEWISKTATTSEDYPHLSTYQVNNKWTQRKGNSANNKKSLLNERIRQIDIKIDILEAKIDQRKEELSIVLLKLWKTFPSWFLGHRPYKKVEEHQTRKINTLHGKSNLKRTKPLSWMAKSMTHRSGWKIYQTGGLHKPKKTCKSKVWLLQ